MLKCNACNACYACNKFSFCKRMTLNKIKPFTISKGKYNNKNTKIR